MDDRRALPLVIFDGDDTLWETEPLYDEARSNAAQIVAKAGFDPEAFEQLQRDIDAARVESMGLSTERFPSSSVEAFRELSRRAHADTNPEVEKSVYAASAIVFTAAAPLMPNAKEVLTALAGSYRIALVTKGVEWVQQRRVDASGLRDFFEVFEIVEQKDSTTFRDLLTRLDAVASECWSIGNSLPSDVAPALTAGMQAVWIDAHVWAHEHRHTDVDLSDSRLHVASSLREVPPILLSAQGATT